MPEIIHDLPIQQVFPNPKQPRKVFDPAALAELSRNIKANGLMQPISVAPQGDDRHMIVCGERRWRACTLAGLTTIPAIVRDDLDANGIAELALIENLLRKDLHMLEEARAYQEFLDRGYTVESLAALLGFEQAWRITERTNLLKLDAKFQDALAKGALTPSQAQEMSRLEIESQWRLWQAIRNGQCETYTKLRRMAQALYDLERQGELFGSNSPSETQRQALDKVDAFIQRAGSLIDLITDDDLTVIESVLKRNSAACIDRLDLLVRISRRVKAALESNLAKQQAMEAAA